MWTNGKKCAVALSFDFDAESLWATLKVNSPTFRSRGVYGAKGLCRKVDSNSLLSTISGIFLA